MRGSLWAWMWQRFSAVLLVVLLGVHFGIMHFVNPTTEITFAGSSARLQSVLYLIVDGGLLLLGLFHGLNGIRNIILDYWPKAGKSAAWVISLLGLVLAGYGLTAFIGFLNAQ